MMQLTLLLRKSVAGLRQQIRPLIRWPSGVNALRALNLLIAVLLLYGTSNLFWSTFTRKMPPIMDFLNLYTGAQIVHQGQSSLLYDLETQATVQDRLLAPYKLPEGVLPFWYPPFVAQALSPLANLPLLTAYGIWTTLGFGLMAVSVWLLSRLLAPTRRLDFLLLVLAFAPLYLAAWQGQTTFLTLALLSAALVGLRRGADLTAGVCLGLGLVKPQLVLLPILLLVWRRQRRAVLGFVGVAILLVSWSVAVVGWPGLMEVTRLVLASAGGQITAAIHPQDMPTLRGVFYPFGAVWRIVWLFVTTLLVSFLLWLWRTRPQLEAQFAAAVVVNLLITPHLYFHDVGLAVLPIAILLNAQWSRRDHTVAWAIGLSPLSLLMWLVLRSVVPVVANLLVVIWMLWLLLRSSQRSEYVEGKA